MTTPPLPEMPSQPPMGYAEAPPPGGGPGAALQKIRAPAVGLIVTGALGMLVSLVSFVMDLLTTPSMSLLIIAMADYNAGLSSDQLLAIVIGWRVTGFLVSAFIVWATMQMKDLRNRTLSIVASVVAMIPCISPCCILGLPIGIWALITINDPAVKGAFRS